MRAMIKAWAYDRHPDIVRIFQLSRYELRGWIAHVAGLLSARQRALLARQRDVRGLRLNIASGGVRREGWICIDTCRQADIRMDLRCPLPFSDGAAALLFCEHFCDHLSFPVVISRFLAECHRVLEPGGRARFVMHDARGLARAYVEEDMSYFRTAEQIAPTLNESVNHLFRFNDFHQFLYDYETFERLLKQAGFSRVLRCGFRESEVRELVLDMDHPSREVMSMYIEAIR